MGNLVIDNRTARRIFMDRHLLSGNPTGPADTADICGVLHGLGFVQVDSIKTVERAQDMILFARRQSYRPARLKKLLEKDRAAFEHWTHDASIIPIQFYPAWRLKFRRDAERLRRQYANWRRQGYAEKFDDILAHIDAHGAVSTADLGKDEKRGSGGWWDWNPSKTALEILWRQGDLAIAGRDGFKKIYDLSHRVIPGIAELPDLDEAAVVEWCCNAAMDRLGFANPKEIASFFDIVTLNEAKDWTARQLAAGDLVNCAVTTADGALHPTLCRPALCDETPPEPPNRIRILSPFDPMLRDRKRAERLFGFRYRIEVFVPAAKRQYGYYVFPILERDRMIGRIDMKRSDGVLAVTALWPEPGISFSGGRGQRLEAELTRMARFATCDGVRFADGWLR